MENDISGALAFGAVRLEGCAEIDSSDADLSTLTAADVEAAGTAGDCGSLSAGI